MTSGLDASGADPLTRMLLYCGGRFAIVHEGAYSEAYVPCCRLAIAETLTDASTDVTEPMLGMLTAQQPCDRAFALQREWIDALASQLFR